jgi:hypothetical protein
MTVFWDVAPCVLAFRRNTVSTRIEEWFSVLKMEAACDSETWITISISKKTDKCDI